MELYLWNKVCNIVLKIKHNIYANLGSGAPPPMKNSGCTAELEWYCKLHFPYTLLARRMQHVELYNNTNLLHSMSYVLNYKRVQRVCTKSKVRARAQAVSRPAYSPRWSTWDFWWKKKTIRGKGHPSMYLSFPWMYHYILCAHVHCVPSTSHTCPH
jgi:hypothetical protein